MATNEQNFQSQTTGGASGTSSSSSSGGRVDQVRQRASDTYEGARQGVSRA